MATNKFAHLYIELGSLNAANARTARMPTDLKGRAITEWVLTRDRIIAQLDGQAAGAATVAVFAEQAPTIAQAVGISVEEVGGNLAGETLIEQFDRVEAATLEMIREEARQGVPEAVAQLKALGGQPPLYESPDIPSVIEFAYKESTVELERKPRATNAPDAWTIRIDGGICGHAAPLAAAFDLAYAVIDRRAPAPQPEESPMPKPTAPAPVAESSPVNISAEAGEIRRALADFHEAQAEKERAYVLNRTCAEALAATEAEIFTQVSAERDTKDKPIFSNPETRKAETRRRLELEYYDTISSAADAADRLRQATAAMAYAEETLTSARALLNHKTSLIRLKTAEWEASTAAKMAGDDLPW